MNDNTVDAQYEASSSDTATGVDPSTGEVLEGEVSTSLSRPPSSDRGALAIGAPQAIAMAAKEQAIVRARFDRARDCPRDWMTVRTKLLAECDRPGFADAAIYSKPVGGKQMEGMSIRFAEACARVAGNIRTTPELIEEDGRRVVYRVSVIDLETNASWDDEVPLAKTVERSTVREGQVAIGERKNTRGKTTYIILANEDEMANKKGSAVSKVARNLILRLMPSDLVDECRARCEATITKRDSKNPAQARNALLDAFSALGVTPKQVGEYIGHDASTISPVEMGKLRPIYAALKEGETTWKDVMGDRAKPAGAVAPPPPTQQQGPPPPPVSTPVPAADAPAQPATTEQPKAEEDARPMDPIDQEKASIRAAMGATKVRKDFQPLLDRIRKLPGDDRKEMEEEYRVAIKNAQ